MVVLPFLEPITSMKLSPRFSEYLSLSSSFQSLKYISLLDGSTVVADVVVVVVTVVSVGVVVVVLEVSLLT